MKVTVHYLAQVKRAAGVARETLTLDAPCTLAELLQKLGEQRDDAFRTLLGQKSMLYFVNDVDAGPDQPLQEGDEIAILAPVAGGSASVFSFVFRRRLPPETCRPRGYDWLRLPRGFPKPREGKVTLRGDPSLIPKAR
jgi:molybdopterin converting factor small subunit